MKSHKPLHLFLYHKLDEATRLNFEQLCEMEGEINVQPISDCTSYLPNTFRADHGKWEFPHWDSYWMCDGLIYKYILNNKDRIISSSTVCINEYDTWWQCSSKDWMPDLMSRVDIAASSVLKYGQDSWVWFEKHKKLDFATRMMGLLPFSVVCIKPELAIEIASRVKNDSQLHTLYNNELRIATTANLLGSNLGPLPNQISKNVKWHGCLYSKEPGIYHPIKTAIAKPTANKKYFLVPESYSGKFNRRIIKQKSKKIIKEKSKAKMNTDFSIITCSFYGNEQSCISAADRIKKSVERFGCSFTVFTGISSESLQDMKITRLIPLIKNLDSKWIMWVDCGDTFCVQDPRRAVDLVKKSGKKILISAEKNCWPEGNFWDQYPVPENNSPNMKEYRYLNSGVFIGKKEDVIEHLYMLEKIMNENASLKEPWMTDQAIWTRLFLNQDKYGASICLDTSCELSVSTYALHLDMFKKSSRDGIKCFKILGSEGKPIILHFNGNDKHDKIKIQSLISYCGDDNKPMDKEYKNNSESFARNVKQIKKIKNTTDKVISEGKFKRSIKRISS